jgi:hypothetical protein
MGISLNKPVHIIILYENLIHFKWFLNIIMFLIIFYLFLIIFLIFNII